MNTDIKKRVKEIAKLEGKRDVILDNIQTFQKDVISLEALIRKVRIGKKSKNEYDIICDTPDCGNVYSTDKDPNAELKDDRPQCKKCGKRVKRKEPVKREDVSKKWRKRNDK